MLLSRKNSARKSGVFFSLIALCSLLLFLGSCGASPDASSDGGTIVTQQAPRANITYVAIGASDTFGIGADDPQTQSWPADLTARMGSGVRLINLGIPSELLHDALKIELPVALDTHPNLITVWLAVNDLAANVPLSSYSQDLDTLLTRLQAGAPQAKIALANVPDLTLLPAFNNEDPGALLAKVQAYNAAISAITARHHVILVDLYTHFNELIAHPEYISGDGLHPSTLGYARIADLFYQALQTGQVGSPNG